MTTKNYNGALRIGSILRSPDLEYRVEKVLGKGGFGITYKVSALKIIQVGNVSQSVRFYFCIKEFFMKGCDRGVDGQAMTYASTLAGDVKICLKDFIVEARRLNKIGTKSKNIVKVNEVFEANGTAYYVMEFLDGGSMAEYVAQHGPLSWKSARNIIIPIAEAVNLLHSERLLHMDIKPANIMLKHNADGKMFPVLIDFGIAKHFDSKGRPTTLDIAKGATEGYAPMEQYSGIDKFAPEIDVYALGATMTYLLTGKQPPKAFDLQTTQSVEAVLPPYLTASQRTAIVKAMEPNKFERTKNTTAFIRDINNAVSIAPDPEPTNPVPPGPQPTAPISKAPVPPRLRRNLIALAVGIAVLVGSIVWGVYRRSGGTNADTTEVKTDTASIRVKEVRNMEITNSEGYTFSYTGPLNDQNMPDGKGTGVYDNGKYTGEYSNGLRQGDGTYETNDGKNRYKGTFYGDQYGEGTLTLADGVYFIGSFQGGQPYNGTWKNPNGSVISEVKNGK